jgi:hypothetical protein
MKCISRVQILSRWDYRWRDQEIGTCMADLGCVAYPFCSGKKWQIEVIKNGSGHILFLAYAAIWELYSHGLPTSGSFLPSVRKKSGIIVVSNPGHVSIVSMNWYQEVILLQVVPPPPQPSTGIKLLTPTHSFYGRAIRIHGHSIIGRLFNLFVQPYYVVGSLRSILIFQGT